MDELKNKLDALDPKQAFVIGVFIAILYYAALFDDGRPLDSAIIQARESIDRDRITLTKVEKALQDKQKFESDISEISQYMKEFQDYFPATYTSNRLVSHISQLAEKNKITITSMKPIEKTSEFPNYPETVVQFKVEGEYHKIMNFISDITQIKKAMDFKGMKFVVAQPSDDPKISLESTLVVYGNTDGFGAENG